MKLTPPLHERFYFLMSWKRQSLFEKYVQHLYDFMSAYHWGFGVYLGVLIFLGICSFTQRFVPASSSFQLVLLVFAAVVSLPFFLSALESYKKGKRNALDSNTVDPKMYSENFHNEINPEDLFLPLTVENLRRIAWQRWETVCQQFCIELGYSAQKTGFGADGGVDIVLRKDPEGSPDGYVQCKAYSKRKVGVKEVRELYGTMSADGVQNGIFFTTGGFSSDAVAFALDLRMELINGADFVAKVSRLSSECQASIRLVAFSGDFSTPYCASCGVPMVRRASKLGSSFWGCKNYPKCRRKLY